LSPSSLWQPTLKVLYTLVRLNLIVRGLYPSLASLIPPQGGTLEYDENEVEKVKGAILDFLGKSDKRATIKAYFRHLNTPKGVQVSHNRW
jgi:hypothetical protein